MALRTWAASESGSFRACAKANALSGRSFCSAVLIPCAWRDTRLPFAFARCAARAFVRLRRAASFCFAVAIPDLLDVHFPSNTRIAALGCGAAARVAMTASERNGVLMATCEVCGNDYDKSFEVQAA